MLEGMNENLYEDIINAMDTTVIPPLYYNEMHQFKSSHDLFCLGGDSIEVYSGNELIDNKTRINVIDINLWDTMKYKVLGILESVENNANETFQSANNFYYDFIRFIGENSFFIYDSDAKGMDGGGVNIVGGNVPYKSFYTPPYISENVTNTLKLFEQSCHYIENQYGHIRVQCVPSKVGNKMKIKFKDYIGHPKEFTPLGNATPEGNASSVDLGYQVEREISEVIDALNPL
jgi:hypothetical protein